MNISQQATDRDFPRDDHYPWRVTVWQRSLPDGEWSKELVYECATEGEAHEDAWDVLSAYGSSQFEMHYYVGEVAR